MGLENDKKKIVHFLISQGGAYTQKKLHHTLSINKGRVSNAINHPKKGLLKEGIVEVKESVLLSDYIPEYRGKKYRGNIVLIPDEKLHDAIERYEIPIQEIENKLFMLLLHSWDIKKIKRALKESDVKYLSNPNIVDILAEKLVERGWIERRKDNIQIKGFDKYTFVKVKPHISLFIREVSLPPNQIPNFSENTTFDDLGVISHWAIVMSKVYVIQKAILTFYDLLTNLEKEERTEYHIQLFLKQLVSLIVYFSDGYFDPDKILNLIIPTKHDVKKVNVIKFDDDHDEVQPIFCSEFYQSFSISPDELSSLRKTLIYRVGILTEVFVKEMYKRKFYLNWLRIGDIDDLTHVIEAGGIPYEFLLIQYENQDEAFEEILKGYPGMIEFYYYKSFSDEEENYIEKLIEKYSKKLGQTLKCIHSTT
jgi:predicted transcriptional regulator